MSTDVYVICVDCVYIDSIECIRDPCLVSTVLTYIVYIEMILYIVYNILFVNTIDMKIKACNALNAMFVKTVDTQHLYRVL